jgi:hypothetical protein
VEHQVIVQTKNWNKPIDQVHLLAFKAILDDLPGQPRGIVVTGNGFQQGARDFGLANGILLYELKPAQYPPGLAITAGGWAQHKLVAMPLQGIVTAGEPGIDGSKAIAYGFDCDVYTPQFSEIGFDVSKSWMENEYPNEDTDAIRKLDFPPGVPFAQMLLHDDAGSVVGNLAEVFGKIVDEMKNSKAEKKRATHTFEPPIFVRSASVLIPRVKVNAVSVTVEILHRHELRRAKMSNFPHLVLHQLNSDKEWWFAATPRVMAELSKPRAKSGRGDRKSGKRTRPEKR